MYNGIGLATPRGSGTNGYVTRNLSFIRKHKDRVDYKSEEEIRKLENSLIKTPNKDILDHERKRKIELKCMEMQELMEEQGYADDAIEKKVAVFRKVLLEKEGMCDRVVEKDEFGRPLARETHQLAEANQEKNARLREAFGLSKDYVDGSSFDPARKAKEQAAKAEALAQKKYALVEEPAEGLDSNSSDSSTESPSAPKKSKKHHKHHHERSRKSSSSSKSKKHHSSKSSSSSSSNSSKKHKSKKSAEKRSRSPPSEKSEHKKKKKHHKKSS